MFEIVQIVLFLLLGFVVTGGVFKVIHWNQLQVQGQVRAQKKPPLICRGGFFFVYTYACV